MNQQIGIFLQRMRKKIEEGSGLTTNEYMRLYNIACTKYARFTPFEKVALLEAAERAFTRKVTTRMGV